jgi:hypothetical protein
MLYRLHGSGSFESQTRVDASLCVQLFGHVCPARTGSAVSSQPSRDVASLATRVLNRLVD